MVEQSVHDFIVKDFHDNEICLNNYNGKVLLIVNTATACGYTPQYSKLQKIYETYKEKGFEVLAFPSNDFGEQEPLTDSGIIHFCKNEYGITFPVFAKIKVRGNDAHPLYQYLSSRKQNGIIQSKPLWNFHKFLIDKNGKVRDFFITITNPDSKRVTKKIEELLVENFK